MSEPAIPERDGSQIRIIVDRGESIVCPICSMKLDAGLGHLCRRSSDGIISDKTWGVSWGPANLCKGAGSKVSEWDDFMQALLRAPETEVDPCADPHDMQGRGGNALATAVMLAAAMVMFLAIVWAVCVQLMK